jgi:hypothetical protein
VDTPLAKFATPVIILVVGSARDLNQGFKENTMNTGVNCHFVGTTKDGREVRMCSEFQTTKCLGTRIVIIYNDKIMKLGRLTTYYNAHAQFHKALGKGATYTNMATGEKFWN